MQTIVTLAIALVLSALSFAAAWYWRQRRPRAENIGILDTAEGHRLVGYVERHGRFRVDVEDEVHTFEPAANNAPVFLDDGRRVDRMRLFIASKAGRVEVPFRPILGIVRRALEEAQEKMLIRNDLNGVGDHNVSNTGVKHYAEEKGLPRDVARKFAHELAKSTRGGHADMYVNAGWKEFVVGNASSLGAAALAAVAVGFMLGTEMMKDPAMFRLLASESAQWIQLVLVAAGVVIVAWRSRS